MEKTKDIAVVSHFALLRSELCDIINKETEYRAQGRDLAFVKSKLTAGNPEGMIFIVDLDSFDANGKQQIKDYVGKNNVSGIIVIFGATDVSAVLSPPYKGSGNFFVPKPQGHLKDNAKFMRNFDIALTRADGLGDLEIVARPSERITREKLEALKALDPLGGEEQELKTPERIVYNGQIERAKDLRPEQRLRAKVDPTGRLLDGNLIVAIASSTGGPKALQDLIPLLPENLKAPVILTQHMPVGFTKSMAERLNEISKIKVKEAEEGDVPKPGYVYIAPGGKHLVVKSTHTGHVLSLSDEAPVGGLKPCADIMYKSLETSKYTTVLAVVLTGMGEDGSKGIVKLAEKKNLYVISQDEATSVVYGMPKAIAEVGYSDEVLPLLSIAPSIQKKVGVK